MMPESEVKILEYLQNNYPDHKFELARMDGDPNGVAYWVTDKDYKTVSCDVTYYPKTGDIKENAPVILISYEFEKYMIDKIKESFPNSKVYRFMENNIDDWNSWEFYEYSLDNFLKYLEENHVCSKEFAIILDSNDYNKRLDQLHDFYSDIDKFHYMSLRLIYVPTEYMDQADNYFTGHGFSPDTPFYKANTSDEWIYVYGNKGKIYLHSTEYGDLE